MALSFEEHQQLQQNLFYHQNQMQESRNDSFLDVANENTYSNVNTAQINANARIYQSGMQTETSLRLQNMKSSDYAMGLTNNLMSGAISGFSGLASNLIGGGLNYLYASNLLDKQAALQRQNFDYTTNKAEGAYEQSGLPSWLAFAGSSAANIFPHQSQSLSGNNFFSSSLPGNTSQLAWTGSQSQLALGVGQAPSMDS